MNLAVYIYGTAASKAYTDAMIVCLEKGVRLADGPYTSDLAIAPLLTRKLSTLEIHAPTVGTLIFHPSLLPRHRGRDAIKWAYKCGETYSGATWFWADEGYDTGDICEQEVLEIAGRPREFYENDILPSMQRMLGFILDDIRLGRVRRRPQQHEHATYEPPLRKEGRT